MPKFQMHLLRLSRENILSNIFYDVIFWLPNFFECIGKKFCTLLTWVFMLFLNPGHKLIEVKKMEMIEQQSKTHHEDNFLQEDPDFLYECLHSHYQTEVDRARIIDEKNRILLTVSTLMLAVVAVIGTKVELHWLILIPVIPIVIAIYLILIHFGVQRIHEPNWESVKNFKSKDKAKKILAKDFLRCHEILSHKNNFRVGLYRAGLRALLIGLGLMLLLFFVVILNHSKANNLEKSLQGNKEIDEMLRRQKVLPGTQDSQRPVGFIDPFGSIEQYSLQGKEGIDDQDGGLIHDRLPSLNSHSETVRKKAVNPKQKTSMER